MEDRQGMGRGKWVRAKVRKSYKTLNSPLAASWCVTEVRMAAERSHTGLVGDNGKGTLTERRTIILFCFLLLCWVRTLNTASILLTKFWVHNTALLTIGTGLHSRSLEHIHLD